METLYRSTQRRESGAVMYVGGNTVGDSTSKNLGSQEIRARKLARNEKKKKVKTAKKKTNINIHVLYYMYIIPVPFGA